MGTTHLKDYHLPLPLIQSEAWRGKDIQGAE